MDEEINEAMNNEVYEELVDYLTNFAKTKLNNEEDVHDVVQETLLKLFKNWKDIRNYEYTKTYATRILINECNDMYAAKSRKTNLIKKLQSILEVEEEIPEEIDIDFSKSKLLDNLTKNERIIVTLHYNNHYKIHEISKILNMNENTVKSHLCRARKKLYKENIARRQNIKTQLSKALILLVLAGIIGTGATFAKNIVNEMKTKMMMFPIKSVQMVEDAIENNYILDTDTEIIYNNNIGIEIDSITMDDKILNISYLLDCKDNIEINKVQLEKYIIKDEKNNILATDINTDLNNKNIESISNGAVTYNYEPQKQQDNNWKCAVLLPAYNNMAYPNSNMLKIEITEISILTSNNKIMKFVGKWNYEIDLQNKFNNRASEFYTYDNKENIKNITAKLNDLSLELKIEFKDSINESVITENNLILEDENGDIVEYISRTISPGNNTVDFVCNIGKYSRNINTLNLYMKYDYLTENKIEVVLNK